MIYEDGPYITVFDLIAFATSCLYELRDNWTN